MPHPLYQLAPGDSLPAIAKIKTNRSTKGKQGEVVEVQAFSKQYPSARCVKQDGGEVVWLSLKNLEYVGPVSAERQAEWDAERAAFKAKGEVPVLVGTDPDWENDKCVGFDFRIGGSIGKSIRPQRMFIPRCKKDGSEIWNPETGTIPQWLYDIKVKELFGRVGLDFDDLPAGMSQVIDPA